jgi:hydrogenase nickel incorporation protein HypA/HybF
MHEAGIAWQVIDACTAHLRTHGASHAACVGLRIGALANVDPEALRFCFDSLKKDTPLDSATLLIEWRSRFGCACEHTPVVLDALPGVCPSCGAAESFADACALDIRYLEFDDGADDADQRAN